MQLFKFDGTFRIMLAIAAVSSAFALIPTAGDIISTIVMVLLLCNWTDAKLFPDAIFLVFIAYVIRSFIVLGLLAAVLGVI